MISIIVVPEGCTEPHQQIRLAPGERLDFGREPAGGNGTLPAARGDGRHQLTVDHEGVSRLAGTISASGSFWSLSNLSGHQTYVVENPEGAGEHLKVSPGRLEAPVPFEFSRLVLPARDELIGFDVWAPRHEYVDPAAAAIPGGVATAPAFPLDRTKRYFLVLAALCEERLRGTPHAPLPTTTQVANRLGTVWPAAGQTSVQWNIDYLAVKLRIKPGPESADCGPRLNGKKETLVSLALRFDLVREDDLTLLGPRKAR